MTPEAPKTLLEACRYYADPKICFTTMIAVKWPDGKIVCPKCGGDQIGVVTSRSVLQCKAKDCRKQFSVKVGTIFEDSPLGLDKWFVAVWCIANAKNGISSLELSRSLGVRQPTAWFMLHRIRAAMKTKSFRKLTGEVEGDETFIGGKAKNMHASRRAKIIKGRGAIGKAIIQGLLERGDGQSVSEFRGFVVKDTSADEMLPNITANVYPESTIYTDSAPAYSELSQGYFHGWVDHISEYVVGRIHTNGIENFWSLLKRMLRGTYVAVASFHLESYLDEQAFRFNQRDRDDAGRFQRVLRAVVGKRLTYRLLTAQGDAGFMGIK
jgi:transposase-like protein